MLHLQTKLLQEIFIMSNVKINPIPAFTPTKSSTSGYSNSDGNKGSNKRNYSGQTFQDTLKQMMKNQSSCFSIKKCIKFENVHP